MKTITLTKKQYDNLTPYNIDKKILNSEAKFFYLDQGSWHYTTQNLLLKKIFLNEDETMSSKYMTVDILNNKEKILGEESLVIPKHFVSVEDEIVGFSIPRIDNATNLGLILDDLKIDIKTKIKYLKQVGLLLQKMQTQNVIDFAFGDLQPFNFLIDEDDKLYAVDLDSCYINNNYPPKCLYLNSYQVMSNIKDYTKYKIKGDMVLPNKQSDLLCYNFMILNTLLHDKITKFNVVEYYNYIKYLESLGYNNDIINCFKSIYSNAININPVEYLDKLDESIVLRSTKKVYEKNKSKI